METLHSILKKVDETRTLPTDYRFAVKGEAAFDICKQIYGRQLVDFDDYDHPRLTLAGTAELEALEAAAAKPTPDQLDMSVDAMHPVSSVQAIKDIADETVKEILPQLQPKPPTVLRGQNFGFFRRFAEDPSAALV